MAAATTAGALAPTRVMRPYATSTNLQPAMARYDFRSPRLYVDAPLATGAIIDLDRSQTNYLLAVLRLKPGDTVLLFNGRDGEWRASLVASGKRGSALNVAEQTRPQTAPGDLHYLFAPLKHARLDYMVQKAVELGASRLQPVMTRHAQAARVNLERMRANAIEAAEQCGILTLPEIAAPIDFGRMASAFERQRLVIFCDEDAEGDPIGTLARFQAEWTPVSRPESAPLLDPGARPDAKPVSTFAGRAPVTRERHAGAPPPLAVLIGPEGGFADDERAALLRLPNVVRLALGPRILRADTAAVAALALVQAVLGDWRTKAQV
jgi:16S rRNA (uracil1498-N3)-methyltransferase